VVALVGAGTASPAAEPLLAELDHSANLSVVRPPQATPAQAGSRPGGPGGGLTGEADAVETATLALRQAARRSSPFALVPADPLAAVAAQWRAMWDVSHSNPAGAVLFEEQAAHALAAWRAGQFELPDYYVVVVDAIPARAASADAPSAGVVAARNVPGGSQAGGPRASRATDPGASLADPALAALGVGDNGPDFYLGPLRATRPHRVCVVAAADGPEQAAAVRDALRSLRHGPWWPPVDVLLERTRRFFAGSLAEPDAPLARG
jgi:hypothetical protein